MKFENFIYLHIIWIVLIIYVIGHYLRKLRDKKNPFINVELKKKAFPEKKITGILIKNKLDFLALIFLIIAIAGLQYGKKLVKTHKEAHQIAIALDTSLSMLAEDIKPNRLSQAKIAIKSILEQLRGDKLSLIGFAGGAFIQCPMTDDIGAIDIFLSDLDTNSIPIEGTSITEALEVCNKSFVNAKDAKKKFIILLTDGEETTDENPIEYAKKLKEEGVIVFTIGIGNKEGAPIPIKDIYGNSNGYLKDDKGNIALTKLDEETLMKIAEITGGKYFYSNLDKSDLDYIISVLKQYKRGQTKGEELIKGINRYYIPASIALILLIISFIIPESIYIKEKKNGIQ